MKTMMRKCSAVIKPWLFKPWPWVIAILLVPQLILTGHYLNLYIENQHAIKSWVKTTGRIIEIERKLARVGPAFRIRVEYEADLNKLQSPFSRWPSKRVITKESFPDTIHAPREGDHVTIYYNPENPKEVNIDPKANNDDIIRGESLWVFTVVAGIIIAYLVFSKKDPWAPRHPPWEPKK